MPAPATVSPAPKANANASAPHTAPTADLRGVAFWVLGPQAARVALLKRALRDYDAALLLEMMTVYDSLRENTQHQAPDGTPTTTARMYRRGVLVWLAYAQAQRFDLTRDDPMMGTLWVRALEQPAADAPALKASTIRTYLAGARRLYACLRRAGVPLNPFSDVQVSRDSRPLWERRASYEGEAPDELIRFAVQEGELVLAYLLSLAVDSGLRISELVMVQYGHLNAKDSELRIPAAKRGKSRIVAVSPRTLDLHARLAPLGRTDRVFPFTTRWFRKKVQALCTLSGVPYQGIHAFRHTHATALVEAGVPLGAIAEQLGHANLTSSMPYLKRPGVEQVKKALAGGKRGP